MRFATTSLTVRQKALYESRNKRLGGGREHGVLRSGGPMDLVEGENLLLSCCACSRRGRRWSGIRGGSRRGLDGESGRRTGVENRPLEASGNISVILVCRGPYTDSCSKILV